MLYPQCFDWLGPTDDWASEAAVMSLSQSSRRVLQWNLPPSTLAAVSPAPASSPSLPAKLSLPPQIPRRSYRGTASDSTALARSLRSPPLPPSDPGLGGGVASRLMQPSPSMPNLAGRGSGGSLALGGDGSPGRPGPASTGTQWSIGKAVSESAAGLRCGQAAACVYVCVRASVCVYVRVCVWWIHWQGAYERCSLVYG